MLCFHLAEVSPSLQVRGILLVNLQYERSCKMKWLQLQYVCHKGHEKLRFRAVAAPGSLFGGL